MKLTTRVRAFFARGLLKGVGIVWVPEWMRHGWIEPSFRALTKEGYRANSAVFACISTLALAFVEPKLRVYDESDEGKHALPAHPLSKLFKHPNEQMGMLELLLYTIVYLAIGGNAYWYKVRSKAGRVVELWVLSDAQIKPIAGGDKLVSHYEFNTGMVSKPERIETTDIVHFKWMIDPMQPWKGMAPLRVAAREVDTDNEVSRYLFTLLKNDAIPRVALVAPADQFIDDDKYKRMMARWQERYGGDNRGLPALLDGGMDIKKIGLDLSELAFEGLHNVPETRIAACLRVPMILAGLNKGMENALGQNQAWLEKSFTQRTLIPLWRMVEEECTADLLPEFDASGSNETKSVAFDLSTVVALEEDHQALRTWVDSAVVHGYVTVNEGRARLGLPRDADGDVYLRGLSIDTVAARVDGQKGFGTLTPRKDANSAKGRETRERVEERKARRARGNAARAIAARRKVLDVIAKGMERDVTEYFGALAGRVTTRLKSSDWRKVRQARNVPALSVEEKTAAQVKSNATAERLVNADDDAELEDLLKRWTVKLLELSWDSWNAELGVEVAFDLTDPLVRQQLAYAGERIKDINETTRAELADILQYGEAHGWSIEDLIAGDPENGIPGIKDVIVETYAGRHESIARTEMSFAQQTAATQRYRDANVSKVYVMDNGLTDDDEPCRQVNNTVQTLEWAEANPIEHPRCTRAFGAWFED